MYVAYGGTIDDTVIIPAGKTVYLNGSSITLTANHHIIVEPGAKLVLEGDITTADDGRLLVKGMVEIHGTLTVTSTGTNDPALQVADYFEVDGKIINGRSTVIGTPRIAVMPNGTLVLPAEDIANQPTHDRFTPAQAWAAAGQGNLVIAGTLPAGYTVASLLEGVALPAGNRVYRVTLTQGGGVLPSLIPAGADITADGVIEDAQNHTLTVNGKLKATNAASTFKNIETLTVNGELIANAATFESVRTLTISTLNSGDLSSRAAAGPSTSWNRSYLGADSATLEKIGSITIGDYGEFESGSIFINLPPGAKISLGRNAIFNASATANNSFDNLTSLFIGPAAKVSIASPSLTFKSLKNLTMQDSASLEAAAGDAVTFLVEAVPSTLPQKTEISLGLNTFYHVGLSPTAKIDVVITRNSSIITGTTINLNEGSTLRVAAGKTFTVESGASIDFRNLGRTVPANAESAPIQINGTVELIGSGTLVGLNPGLFTSPTDIYKFIAFMGDGRIVLNHGATYAFGSIAAPALSTVPFIGSGTTDVYRWNGTNDGAQIILNAAGITIRDADGGGAVVTANMGDTDTYAYILKEQTLTLDTRVQLKSTNNKGIYFAGWPGGGARFKGMGSIVVGATTITGGSSGWQVFGSKAIGICQDGTNTASISDPGASATIFKAMGPSAVIRQAAVRGNSVTIQPNATVDLGGTPTSPGGSIMLEAGSNSGRLILEGSSSKVLLGTGLGGAAVGKLGTIAIGGRELVNSGFNPGDFTVLNNKLVMLGGTNKLPGSYITAGTAAKDDVAIVSNATFSNR
jgi:hypothetical protein